VGNAVGVCVESIFGSAVSLREVTGVRSNCFDATFL